MPEPTGTFFDVDPENWKEFVEQKESETNVKQIVEKTAEEKAAEEQAANNKFYWECAKEIVNKWARYQAAKKLYINATHRETYHRVKSVVNDPKYYDGNTSKIKTREQTLMIQLKQLLAEFDGVCKFHGVRAIDLGWLYDNLKVGSDYARYRSWCQRNGYKSKPVVSLRDF